MILTKTLKILFSLFLVCSCAIQKPKKIELPKNNNFRFRDATGEYLLKKDAIKPGLDLSFLNFITFIAVIAAMVQLVEMIIDKVSPALYNALGIFLPLITVNCAILGASLFMVERSYTLGETAVFGFGAGVGWFLAILGLAAITQKLTYSHPPKGLKGSGLTFIVTGLMAMAFMCFAGIKL